MKKKKEVHCPFCNAVNPPTAYACISCFKVMKDAYRVPFWQIQVPTFASAIVICITLFGATMFVVNRWLRSVEAEMTIKVQTSEYNISVVADKVRRKKSLTVEKNAVPADGSTSTAETPEEK